MSASHCSPACLQERLTHSDKRLLNSDSHQHARYVSDLVQRRNGDTHSFLMADGGLHVQEQQEPKGNLVGLGQNGAIQNVHRATQVANRNAQVEEPRT
jgi:hypothetical protein